MAAPLTAEDFLECLKRSQLLHPELFPKVQEKLNKLGPSARNPKKIAAALVKWNLITKFQAKQLLSGRHKGFYIAKYKLLELLGAGGMGKVYLAEQVTMQRLVAIKIVRQGKKRSAAQNEEVLKRFTREARAIAALRHQNIIHAYDFDQEDGTPYIVMEYIDGIDVSQQLKTSGKLSWKQAAHYIAQAAAGLDHAHNAGLVHRDIKPGNMLISTKGEVKLLDLGLVSCFESEADDSLTTDANQIGTADYIAPEQAVDSHLVDARADIYSLGATFYTLITGQILFPGKTTGQKLLAHQTTDPQPVRELVPEVPEEVETIINKMLAKKREDRYQEAAEVRRLLKPFGERITPPFDLSAVKYPRKEVTPFLKHSPDPSSITVGGDVDATAGHGSEGLSGTDVQSTELFSDEQFMDTLSTHIAHAVSQTMPPSVYGERPPRTGGTKKKRKGKKKQNEFPVVTTAVGGGAILVLFLVYFTIHLFTDQPVGKQVAGQQIPETKPGQNNNPPAGELAVPPSGPNHTWIGNTLVNDKHQNHWQTIHIYSSMPVTEAGKVDKIRIRAKANPESKMFLYHLRPEGESFRVIAVTNFTHTGASGIHAFRIPLPFQVQRGDVLAHSGSGGPFYRVNSGSQEKSYQFPAERRPKAGDLINPKAFQLLGNRYYAFQYQIVK